MTQKAVAQATQAVKTPAATPQLMLQRACACGQHTPGGGECAECRKKTEGTLQRAAVGSASVPAVPSIVHDVLRSPGRPLDAATRAFMEPRFGHDFSGVRVHTDDRATESARAVQARAYTVGPDIVFNAGHYSPGTTPGRQLLAHELTHVMQQQRLRGTASASSLSAAEAEAEQSSQAVALGRQAIPVGQRTGIGLARAMETKNLSKLSDDDLQAEHMRVQQWLSGHSLVELDYAPTQDYFQEIEQEVRRRSPSTASGASAQAPISPGLSTGGLTANSFIQGYDANVRISNYVEPAERLAEQVLADVESGKITHLEGRVAASEGRNALLSSTREELSPGGRSFSRAIKEEGKTLPQLVEKYARKILTDSPQLMEKFGLQTLDPKSPLFDAAKYERAIQELGETAEVSGEIIKAAGRTGKVVTVMARFSRVAGPAGFVLSAGVSTYEIIKAPEGQKLHVAGREASGIIGGALGATAGGLVAGWTASLLCGPAAPVCAIVVSVTIVGGAAYAGGKVGEKGYEKALRSDTDR